MKIVSQFLGLPKPESVPRAVVVADVSERAWQAVRAAARTRLSGCR